MTVFRGLRPHVVMREARSSVTAQNESEVVVRRPKRGAGRMNSGCVCAMVCSGRSNSKPTPELAVVGGSEWKLAPGSRL